MSSRRPVILMAVLLVLLAGFATRSLWQLPDLRTATPAPTAQQEQPLLPGENSISNVVVSQTDAGEWLASFDYYNTGKVVWIQSDVEYLPDQKVRADWSSARLPSHKIKRGHDHGEIKIDYPGAQAKTRHVLLTMHDASGTVLASARVDRLIEWPSWDQWQQEREFAQHSKAENLDRAIDLIDQGSRDGFAKAKAILERLIQADPGFQQAYIELARVAMKTNWGPEGLHHAEGLLSSALQIKPDDVNAKILLGYVYTHQNRYKPAEKLFAEAAATDPPNLWLWANWGEMLMMQGKFDQAIAKYEQAAGHPATQKTYERARADAYDKLLALLERKKDLDGMEVLYQSGVEVFGYSSCHTLRYARFLLQRRGNPEGAIELAQKATDVNCGDDNGREILGLAHYVAWSKREGTSRIEALNRARIYLPPGARAMYLLAGSETTVKAAAQLVASGENIDNKDNDQFNALAYALQNEDVTVARRLLRLGASPTTGVGLGDVPVALMPVMAGNLEMVKLMREFGADYAKISYQGATAFDFAKQTGDPGLMLALEPTPRAL